MTEFDHDNILTTLTLLALPALVGCAVEASDQDDRVSVLEDTVAGLTAQNTALAETVANLRADITQNTVDILANTSSIEAIEAGQLTGIATETYVTEAIAAIDLSIYLTATDLDGYATEAWTVAQGYDIAAEITANSERLSSIEVDYLTSTSLEGYTTETWFEEQGYVVGLADYLSVDTSTDEVIFSGANIYIQSGSGATDDDCDTNGDFVCDESLTGLGNLIIGYAEDARGDDDRTGSHNLIIGAEHSYTSYGGLIAGWGNTISGPSSSVTGGEDNVASGEVSAISGGSGNIASGYYSAVSGGADNVAAGDQSTVSGGKGVIARAE